MDDFCARVHLVMFRQMGVVLSHFFRYQAVGSPRYGEITVIENLHIHDAKPGRGDPNLVVRR